MARVVGTRLFSEPSHAQALHRGPGHPPEPQPAGSLALVGVDLQRHRGDAQLVVPAASINVRQLVQTFKPEIIQMGRTRGVVSFPDGPAPRRIKNCSPPRPVASRCLPLQLRDFVRDPVQQVSNDALKQPAADRPSSPNRLLITAPRPLPVSRFLRLPTVACLPA